MRVFSSGDGVEAFAFDQCFQRFAVSSHYGKVKMFRFERGDLVELWADELLDAIPRAVFFTDKGQSVSIFGMENGTVCVVSSRSNLVKPNLGSDITATLKLQMQSLQKCLRHQRKS